VPPRTRYSAPGPARRRSPGTGNVSR
jgi:hypothetical protein